MSSIYVVIIAAAAFLAASLLQLILREGCVGSGLERWKRQCGASERNAAALALGYLISQVVRFSVTGIPRPAKLLQSRQEGWWLFGVGLGLMLLTLVSCVGLERLVVGGASRSLRRCVQLLQGILAMSMGWCLLYSVTWFFSNGLGSARGGDDMASSMVMLLACFGGTVLLIFFVTYVVAEDRGPCCRRCLKPFMNALGLILGWSLEACTQEALRGTSVSSHLPSKAVIPVLHVVLPLVALLLVLPAWSLYVLPRAEQQLSTKAPASASEPDRPLGGASLLAAAGSQRPSLADSASAFAARSARAEAPVEANLLAAPDRSL